jgi:hypothetical protein
MDKPTPDIGKVRREFIRGGNHPDDVDGMFNLYRRFRQVSYMQKAVRAWSAADGHMALLEDAGTTLQREMESTSPSPARIQAVLAEVSTINDNLTPIENQFVDALSEASRATYQWLQAIMLAAAPALLGLGTALSMRILQ